MRALFWVVMCWCVLGIQGCQYNEGPNSTTIVENKTTVSVNRDPKLLDPLRGKTVVIQNVTEDDGDGRVAGYALAAFQDVGCNTPKLDEQADIVIVSKAKRCEVHFRGHVVASISESEVQYSTSPFLSDQKPMPHQVREYTVERVRKLITDGIFE